MSAVKNVTEADFTKEVLEAEELVVVDFSAEWCGPCRMIAPTIDRAAATFEGRARFVKCDVDSNPNLAQQYGAMRIPNLIFFKNGQVVDQSIGGIGEAQLAEKVNAAL
ncbi:MAG TPA: thioredoxin [Abditibacteriaceae bacterium]|jgi:thioredoxin 1